MRYLRGGLLGLGIVLLVALIVDNDPGSILTSFSQLSWRLLIVLCFPMILVVACDTLGWRFAFRRDRVAFGTLLSARLAGEAFNLTTPTATMGGEAVKTWLLRGHVPLEESLPSVIVAKTTITIAQGFLLLLGVVLAGATLPAGSPLLVGMQWLLIVQVVMLAIFVALQIRGVLGWTVRVLDQIGPLRAWWRPGVLRRADAVLARFYRRQLGRLVLSIFWHLVAWLLGAVETYLILQFMGLDVSLATATVIEAFGTAIRLATFVVPASVGVLEGGFVAIFAALGLAPSAGISFSLIRRVREMAWVGAGLVAFAAMRPVAASDEPRESPSRA
ncbi:MAG TPA: lysylphosphatidylglycerol synthase transmembrane domain-containing protein [Methylomirabilota bacterium]|jgi:putative membrane protein